MLNATLLKTNLLPIIKFRAQREKKNSPKNKKIKSKVKIFHSDFCGNRCRSSVTGAQKSVRNSFLHSLNEIAGKL